MKRNFKIIIAYIIVLLVSMGIVISLSNRQQSTEKISIIATNFPAYDFARAVAGDRAEIKMLVKPGTETHDFEPTPQDVIDIKNSELFIYTGGESDAWVERILGDVDTGKTRLLKMMDVVEVVKEEDIPGAETAHERSMYDEYNEHAEHSNRDEHDKHDEYDEHVWTSLRNAIKIVDSLKNELIYIAPGDESIFKNRAKSYTDQLTQLDLRFQEVVDKAARNTVVFGDRFPLRYFADDYGLNYFAAFPGCSEQTEASSQTIAFLIDKIKTENIPVVFKIEMTSDNVAKTIAEASGAKVLTFHAAHNISVDDFQNGRTYAEIMTENLQVLEEALN